MVMTKRAKEASLPKQISAAEFKAKCLDIMDLVQERGGEVVVTKRGKAVAKLVPIQEGTDGHGHVYGSEKYEDRP